MAEIKLTKNELRAQQQRLNALQKYLPTLQLKKAMLQSEIQEARNEVLECEKHYQLRHQRAEEYGSLLTQTAIYDPMAAAKIEKLHRRYENIAGVEIPYFESITFADYQYDLFDTPPWFDSLIAELRALAEAFAHIKIALEKKAALEKELRDVSIKVNLFEKILIPRATKNIRKIKVFLGDQQLAAVSQAKVAKRKIEEQKKHYAY